ncbi:MAG: dual specificity protein phosphatase family protein [Spirochaetota bacterium]
MKIARKKYLLPIIPFVFVIFLLTGWSQYDNFHVVTDGVIYRSKQLDAKEFTGYIKKYKIKSVLNLRGEHKNSDWYRDEMNVMEQYRVRHFDFRLSAVREVDPETLDKIMGIIKNAPKPVLIHCQGGSDRTGLVCAVWKYREENKEPEAAAEQLSLVYGHFPYLWSETDAMDRSFRRYVQKKNKLERITE